MLPSAAVSRRWFLLALLTVAYGMGAFGMLGVSPLTPSLVDGFGLTRLQVAFIVPSVYVGGLFFSLPAGRLADRWGVRPTFLGGLAVGAGGLALAAGAPGFSLFLAGIGWSVVNPVLGKAIVDLFPVRERGFAMGIKQMGLTVGGVISALILPSIAAAWSWRVAVAACALAMGAPVLASWRTLAPLALARVEGARAPGEPRVDSWWWLWRPPLLTLFGAGLALGMVQSAVLAYLPLYGVEVLGLGAVAAGGLVAAAQAGGAVARLGLGAASDRWLGGRRPPWLVVSSIIGAAVFASYAMRPR
jgi:ACS family hexuronate transporter-like MFS transporter